MARYLGEAEDSRSHAALHDGPYNCTSLCGEPFVTSRCDSGIAGGAGEFRPLPCAYSNYLPDLRV